MTVPVQLQLFNDLPIPPRPSRFSDKVLEETLDGVMPGVMKWLDSPDEDEDEVRENVKTAIEFDDDSYAIAKCLEDVCYWDVDRELINVLDEVASSRDKAHKDAVYAWVVQNCVTPKFALEQKVQYKHKCKAVTGVITRIYEKEASYLVLSQELGHVREGIGVHGNIVPYEDVKAVDEGEKK